MLGASPMEVGNGHLATVVEQEAVRLRDGSMRGGGRT